MNPNESTYRVDVVRLRRLLRFLVKVQVLLDERIRRLAVFENRNVDDHFSASACVDVQRERLEARMPVVDRLLRDEDRLDLTGAQIDRVLWKREVFAAISARREAKQEES